MAGKVQIALPILNHDSTFRQSWEITSMYYDLAASFPSQTIWIYWIHCIAYVYIGHDACFKEGGKLIILLHSLLPASTFMNSSETCQKCGSNDTHEIHSGSVAERFLNAAGYQTYRCRNCEFRWNQLMPPHTFFNFVYILLAVEICFLLFAVAIYSLR